MHRRFVGFFLIAIAGLAYASTQPWMAKPYQQWTENDVREILSRSPWVKEATVMASWDQPGLDAATANQGQPSSQPQPQQQRPGMGAGNPGEGPQQPGMGGQQQSAEGRDVTYFIRWNSAQTIRDAIARQAILNGRASQSQLEQYVDQQPTTYQIFVYGPDMTPFAKETNDTLQSEAYLEVKPSKEKINPAAVEIVQSQDKKQITGVLFSFAKQGVGDKPMIGADAKQAHFDCKLRLIHLSANFDLRKMVGKNGPEL